MYYTFPLLIAPCRTQFPCCMICTGNGGDNIILHWSAINNHTLHHQMHPALCSNNLGTSPLPSSATSCAMWGRKTQNHLTSSPHAARNLMLDRLVPRPVQHQGPMQQFNLCTTSNHCLPHISVTTAMHCHMLHPPLPCADSTTLQGARYRTAHMNLPELNSTTYP